MHLPFVEVEGAKSTLRIGVAGSNFFSFVPGLRSDNINTDLSIRRRPGHKNLDVDPALRSIPLLAESTDGV